MFGNYQSIIDVFPNYMLDYQEITDVETTRWTDRVIPDGSWSGNMYDFFRRVYPKLIADLKIPFQLKDGQRIEETPVHAALREALLNALIHADYKGRTAILILKQSGAFSFRNPGNMRIPLNIAIAGNHSDCRNRRIQQLFRHVGYVEHAGSGIPQIYRAWNQQHWQQPQISEQHELNQTLVKLHTSSLFPRESIEMLKKHLGMGLGKLSDNERVAMLLAQTEGSLRHARLVEICPDHRADLSKMLSDLVRKSLLVPSGKERGMSYHLPWQPQEFSVLSMESDPLSMESDPLSMESDSLSEEIIKNEHDAQWQVLEKIAQPFKLKKRIASADKQAFQSVIYQLCRQGYLEGEKIALLLGRNAVDLRQRYLNPMVESGLLERRNANPNASNQAYKAR